MTVMPIITVPERADRVESAVVLPGCADSPRTLDAACIRGARRLDTRMVECSEEVTRMNQLTGSSPPLALPPVAPLAPLAPLAAPRASTLALAAAGPVAIGAILAAHAGVVAPIAAAPAIVFGVVAATSPALYIAIAATGDAPPLSAVARALGLALGAFGIALAGLVLPAAFLSLTSVSALTTSIVCSCALGGAALLAMKRLADELATTTLAASVVMFVWSAATLGIAGRLWWNLASEVAS
jgi:hypothetical protein